MRFISTSFLRSFFLVKSISIIVSAMVFLLPCTLYCAEQPQSPEEGSSANVSMDEVVVTASRYSEEISKVPADVTVITTKDIQNSTATNVPELLRSQAGIQVTDISGNQRDYKVDIRGFGETAQANTLVLVDGRRVTQADLSGTDWFLIPLERIERIEIVRGGGGSVLYGDNATGGVINIITKPGEKTRIGAEAAAGSYKTFTGAVYGEGKTDRLSYAVNGDYFTTNGYRLNSGIDAKNAGGSINYFPSELITLNLSSGYHKDNTGLPGALTETNLETLSRKDSVHPNDYANTEDYYFKATPEINFWGDSLFKVDTSYRKRDVFEFASFTGGDSTGDTELSTIIVSPQALLKFKLAGQFANRLTFGMDYQHAKEEITNNLNLVGFPPTTGFPTLQKTNYGYYALEEIDPFPNLTLSGGYRYDQAKFEFSPSNPSDVTDYEHAITAGVNYKFTGSSQAYFNYSRSFRYPLLDELYNFQTNTITVLQPQSSNGYELGVRHKLMERLRAGVNLFEIDTDNEIFYDPITFQNSNLTGTTKREGIEVNFNFQAFDWASVYATYTYTHTEIEGGQFDGKKIPGVPNHLGSIGTTLQITKGFTFDVVGYYVGGRPFISDFNNALEEQNDYFLVNTKLRYNWKYLTAYLNVNNVTNRKYSEFGVVTYSGQKAYYPSPETNFLAGLAVDF